MNELVILQHKKAVTTSLNISKNFEKRHDHVLRDVENIKKDVPNFGEMFQEVDIPDSYGRPRKAYLINRDGFTLLAMGFTGKKALQFKLKYIEAFNKMESSLLQLTSEDQMKIDRLETMRINAETRQATLAFKIAMETTSLSGKENLLAKAAEILTGEKVLPIMREKEYTATDIAKKLGTTAQMVGRISNLIGIKAEQPGQNEYGRWGMNKSPHSNKEVAQWIYFEKGFREIEKAMNDKH